MFNVKILSSQRVLSKLYNLSVNVNEKTKSSFYKFVSNTPRDIFSLLTTITNVCLSEII